MDIKDIHKFADEKLENMVDDFLEEHGYEYVVPSPLESPETQLQRLREAMLYKLTFKEYDLSKGLKLIFDFLPQRISSEEWESVLKELRQVEGRALEYFDNEELKSQDKSIRPTYQILGLSLETYRLCRDLLYDFVREGDYQRVQDLSFFLVSLYQDKVVPWLGVGRSYDKFCEHHKAIEIYERIHEIFPDDPISYIFCAWSYNLLGEKNKARNELDRAEKLLNKDEEMSKSWKGPLVDIKRQL